MFQTRGSTSYRIRTCRYRLHIFVCILTTYQIRSDVKYKKYQHIFTCTNDTPCTLWRGCSNLHKLTLKSSNLNTSWWMLYSLLDYSCNCGSPFELLCSEHQQCLFFSDPQVSWKPRSEKSRSDGTFWHIAS